MKILVTGGAGFIGHHFVNHLLLNTDWEIVVLDKLTYAANGLDRLRDINCFDEKRVRLFAADFSMPISPGVLQETRDIDYLVHMGAETHVDRSIDDPMPFVISNVLGTQHMLNYARQLDRLKTFVMFSTDEVFGPAPEGVNFPEDAPYNASNPYAASKAAAEQLCVAAANTWKIPVIITNTMNCFGERQHPEKFIPLCVRKILKGERITIHGTKDRTKAGTRFYIHCRNVADALTYILQHAVPPDRFNIVGEREVSNLEVAQLVASHLGRPLIYEIVDFHGSRPGHDLRYGISGEKLARFGWAPPKTFEESLRKTIDWMLRPANLRWLLI